MISSAWVFRMNLLHVFCLVLSVYSLPVGNCRLQSVSSLIVNQTHQYVRVFVVFIIGHFTSSWRSSNPATSLA